MMATKVSLYVCIFVATAIFRDVQLCACLNNAPVHENSKNSLHRVVEQGLKDRSKRATGPIEDIGDEEFQINMIKENQDYYDEEFQMLVQSESQFLRTSMTEADKSDNIVEFGFVKFRESVLGQEETDSQPCPCETEASYKIVKGIKSAYGGDHPLVRRQVVQVGTCKRLNAVCDNGGWKRCRQAYRYDWLLVHVGGRERSMPVRIPSYCRCRNVYWQALAVSDIVNSVETIVSVLE